MGLLSGNVGSRGAQRKERRKELSGRKALEGGGGREGGERGVRIEVEGA